MLGIRELADRATGEVTIGAVPTATYYFLPRVIEDFNAQYPRIRIRILDLSANDVLEAVKRGQAEFGINLLGAQEPDLDFEPLLRDPFLFVCRKDHPLARLEQVRWADIAPYRFITVGRLSGNRIILDAALAGLQVRPRWFYEVQHLSTSLGLVEAGLGRGGGAAARGADRASTGAGRAAAGRSGGDAHHGHHPAPRHDPVAGSRAVSPYPQGALGHG